MVKFFKFQFFNRVEENIYEKVECYIIYFLIILMLQFWILKRSHDDDDTALQIHIYLTWHNHRPSNVFLDW